MSFRPTLGDDGCFKFLHNFLFSFRGRPCIMYSIEGRGGGVSDLLQALGFVSFSVTKGEGGSKISKICIRIFCTHLNRISYVQISMIFFDQPQPASS